MTDVCEMCFTVLTGQDRFLLDDLESYVCNDCWEDLWTQHTAETTEQVI